MTSVTTNVRENVMLFNFYLTDGSEKVYLIQAKKITFVETGKNAESFIWVASIIFLAHQKEKSDVLPWMRN